MSIENGTQEFAQPFPAPGHSDAGTTDVLAAAKQQGGAVAHSAMETGKDVAHEASAQVAAAAGQAKEQISAVLGQAQGELKSQVDARSQQAAAGLQTLSKQLQAMSEGRPGEAGHVATLMSEAQQRVQSYARTLEQRGPTAIIDDVASFARRRPFRFLLMAGVAGFAAGRLARSGVAVAHEEKAAEENTATLGNGAFPTGNRDYAMAGQGL